MIDAFIGLGANLQHPIRQLDSAVTALRGLPASRLLACSPYYRSTAIGPGPQPDYINAAAHISTALPAQTLLTELQSIEARQGRRRTTRWGPRTLDLDLLLYGQTVMNEPRLTLPHPGIGVRNFVLFPLFDIAPKLLLPDGRALRNLASSMTREGLWRLLPETCSASATSTAMRIGN